MLIKIIKHVNDFRIIVMLKFFFENIHTIMFYVLSFTSISLSLIAVCTNKTLRSAIFLCAVMVINSGFYLLLGSEFLAVIQMLVYVSGIVILLIFVIMLTNTLQSDEIKISFLKQAISALIAFLFFIANVFIITLVLPNKNSYALNFIKYDESNLAKIGFKILDINQTGYILSFEMISILLLIVLIGCLKIARK